MQGNYSLENLKQRADLALEVHRAKYDKMEEEYKQFANLRVERKLPTIALVGMGRAGKDTAAEIIAYSEYTDIPAPKSASLIVLPLIAHMVGLPDYHVYDNRHANRAFWIAACHAIREGDVTRIVRYCLSQCPLVIGIRGKEEFRQVVETNMVDLTVWIGNKRVSVDPTVEFSRDDCDIVIDNNGTLEEFTKRVEKFAKLVFAK